MNRKIDTIEEMTTHLEFNQKRVKAINKQIAQVKQNNYRSMLLEDLAVVKNNVKFYSGRVKHLQEQKDAKAKATLEATEMRLNKVMYLIGLEDTSLNDYQDLVEESSWLETEISVLKRQLA